MEEKEPYIIVSSKLPHNFQTQINVASKDGYEVIGAPISHGDKMHVLMKYVNPQAMADMMSKMMAGMPGGMQQ